jgi:hypothetical protein
VTANALQRDGRGDRVGRHVLYCHHSEHVGVALEYGTREKLGGWQISV